LATQLVPSLAKAQIHEAWAGLRPATSDKLPILGETSIGGYYAATGHFRDGILLAPITAHVMTELILDNTCSHDLSAFSLERFSTNRSGDLTYSVLVARK
jgi:glycine oxidase